MFIVSKDKDMSEEIWTAELSSLVKHYQQYKDDGVHSIEYEQLYNDLVTGERLLIAHGQSSIVNTEVYKVLTLTYNVDQDVVTEALDFLRQQIELLEEGVGHER